MPTQDKWVTYAKEHKKEFLERIIPTPLLDKEDRIAYLTAGGSGSGKSEFREAALPSEKQVCIIDPDKFRQFFPGYDGKNAADYQHAASYLVDYCFGKLIRKKPPMVLDSTFEGRRVLQNIQRLLDHDFTVKLFYVYEHPQTAWDFAQHRSRKFPGKRSNTPWPTHMTTLAQPGMNTTITNGSSCTSLTSRSTPLPGVLPANSLTHSQKQSRRCKPCPKIFNKSLLSTGTSVM